MQYLNEEGKPITSEEVESAFSLMLQKATSETERIEPPKNLREFEDRIGMYLNLLYERTFGVVMYLDDNERKTVEKDLSVDHLIEIGLKIDRKYKDQPFIINQQLDCYGFLKKALEKGYPFASHIQDLLGIPLDLSPISKVQREQIGFQVAAQVLWFLNKDTPISTKAMAAKILNNKFLKSFLKLRSYYSLRVIENHIREFNPHKPSKVLAAAPGSSVMPIPGVFLEGPPRINFQRLSFIVKVFAGILKGLGVSKEEIFESEFIAAYSTPLQFYPKLFIGNWVTEGMSKEGSIHTL